MNLLCVDADAEGFDDEEVAVDGDEDHGVGREEDAGRLDGPDRLAQRVLKYVHY